MKRLLLRGLVGVGVGILVAALPQIAYAECSGRWDVGGSWAILQGNGFTVNVEIAQTRDQLQGSGSYTTEGGFMSFGASDQGPLTGSLNGNTFSFIIDWGGTPGLYEGAILDSGHMSGHTAEVNNPGAGTSWSTDHLAKCVEAVAVDPFATEPVLRPPGEPTPADIFRTEPPAAETQPPPPPSQRMVTVLEDVDVYDAPGGEGQVIGMLRQGESVPLGGCRDDYWCEITARGWVWGEFLAL